MTGSGNSLFIERKYHVTHDGSNIPKLLQPARFRAQHGCQSKVQFAGTKNRLLHFLHTVHPWT